MSSENEPGAVASAQQLATALIAMARRATTAYDRPDLARQLDDLTDRLEDPTVRVLVAGEFKTGKSSLVNALLGQVVCPVDAIVATAVPTAVRYAAAPAARVVVRGDDGEPTDVDIEVDEVAAWVSESEPGVASPASDALVVEIGCPVGLLRGGMVIVDLPGVGGVSALPGVVALDASAQAQGIIMVTDSGQPLTADELAFTSALGERCARVMLVETRIDLHPNWRTVVALDTDLVGTSVELVVPTSSALVLAHGEDLGDGVTAIRSWLRSVVNEATVNDALFVADTVQRLAAVMREPFEAELAALTAADDETGSRGSEATRMPMGSGGAAASENDEGAQRPSGSRGSEATRMPMGSGGAAPSENYGHLARWRDESQRLRVVAGRWSQLLSDSFTDVSSDVDHALRDRLRDLARTTDQELEDVDPASSWTEFEAHVRRQSGEVGARHFELLDARVAQAVERLAQFVTPDAGTASDLVALIERRVAEGDVLSDAADRSVALPVQKKPGLGSRGFTLLRSSYGSALMLGFVGSVAGLTIAAPAILAAGVAMGARGLRQETSRMLQQRQHQAKGATRQYLDEVSFVLAKETRDRVKRIQRICRDTVTERVEEMTSTAKAAEAAAVRAVTLARDERNRARRDAEAEVERLTLLVETARQTRGSLTGVRHD